MKNALFFLLLFVTASCLPKKDDPEPDLAGTYQVSQIIEGNVTTTYPSNGQSIAIVVTRRGDTQIDLEISTTVNGRTTSQPVGTADIRKAKRRDYDILDSGKKVGTINGTDFVLEETDANGTLSKIVARK